MMALSRLNSATLGPRNSGVNGVMGSLRKYRQKLERCCQARISKGSATKLILMPPVRPEQHT